MKLNFRLCGGLIQTENGLQEILLQLVLVFIKQRQTVEEKITQNCRIDLELVNFEGLIKLIVSLEDSLQQTCNKLKPVSSFAKNMLIFLLCFQGNKSL